MATKLGTIPTNHIKDLAGQTFNYFVVLGLDHVDKNAYWKCRCVCGSEEVVKSSTLINGSKRSCGCEYNLSGKIFGYLTVLHKDFVRYGNSYWRCRCKCGEITSVSRGQLVYGDTISCGCAKSYYETKLFNLVKQIYPNHQVKRNYTPIWLHNTNTGGNQHIDVAVLEGDKVVLAIEYDGIQHFEPVRFGNISAEEAEENLKYRKIMDKRKTELCNKYAVRFVRLNYQDEINLSNVSQKIHCTG